MFNRDANKLLATIFDLGAKLKRLVLVFKKQTMIGDDQFWRNLAKLTKLRLLTLDVKISNDRTGSNREELTYFNMNGLILLLNTCAKFKLFRYNGRSFLCEYGEKIIRREVANKLFRQRLVARFDSSLVNRKMVIGLQGVFEDCIC